MTRREAKFQFRRLACGRRLIDSIKGAQVAKFASYFNVGNKPTPLASVEPHPRSPGATVGPERTIHKVPCWRRLTQVGPSVIRPVAIDVIDKFRPAPFLNGKGYAMSQKNIGSEWPHEVARCIPSPERHLPSAPTIPLTAPNFSGFVPRRVEVAHRPSKPSQASAYGVVCNAIAEISNIGQRLCSHIAVLSRCGQGRAVLAHCFRPAFSSRITICSQAEATL